MRTEARRLARRGAGLPLAVSLALLSRAADAEEEPGDRLSWRGTGATLSHRLTTTALGVGQRPLGRASEQYVQGYTVLLNWFALDGARARLRLATAPGADVELTDSDTSVREREVLLRDLPLTASTAATLYEHPQRPLATQLAAGATVTLPTSKESRDDGTLLLTSPRLALAQRLPLDDHPFAWVELYLGLGWTHRFSRATEPVSARLVLPRQTLEGTSFRSDQLSGARFARDVLHVTASALVEQPLGRGALWFEWGVSFGLEYFERFEPAQVRILTGWVEADRGPQASGHRELAGFGATLYYFPAPEAGVSLGYSNQETVLAPSGQRRSPFYAPSAVFTASIIVGFDALWLAAHGRRRDSPYFLGELL